MSELSHLSGLIISSTIALAGLGVSFAWSPLFSRSPATTCGRLFLTVGLIVFTADSAGVGAVLGLELAVLGIFVAREGRPASGSPRPECRSIYLAAVLTGLASLGIATRWGPFNSIPDNGDVLVFSIVAGLGTLATVAIADHARSRLRESL